MPTQIVKKKFTSGTNIATDEEAAVADVVQPLHRHGEVGIDRRDDDERDRPWRRCSRKARLLAAEQLADDDGVQANEHQVGEPVAPGARPCPSG